MLGVAAACQSLGVPRSTLYRARQRAATEETAASSHPTPARALSAEEKIEVRTILNSEQYQNRAPREVYADLLDDGVYLCSWRSMYRILQEHDEVRERRNQLRHPSYQRPELLATAPNQLWSWDITKLRGSVKWSYYYLYVLMDVYSRYVVGWMLAERESAELAKQLIAESCTRQEIQPDQLTIHADNGSAMIAKSVTQLMVDLSINKTHSRPHVSNDNPFSEAHFKTLKYCPEYPGQFGSLVDARQWSQTFFTWLRRELSRTVQPPAPPHRHWPAHASRCPSRTSRNRASAAPEGLATGLCRTS